MLARKFFLAVTLTFLVFGIGACGGNYLPVPSTSTSITDTPIETATLSFPTVASALATRAPATQRTATPTRASVFTDFQTISLAELPPEARETLDLIERGGPFPYRQDSVVFQNREGLLPKKPRGYYHEYTVQTPGEKDRGARRIITGEQGEFYYTDDHYASFKVIIQS